jgi:phosphoinositide-3-kinase regulatory subunit 4
MRHLATDPDVFVRATYAQSLVRLANVAVGMLEMSQAAKVDKTELEDSGIVEVSRYQDIQLESSEHRC